MFCVVRLVNDLLGLCSVKQIWNMSPVNYL